MKSFFFSGRTSSAWYGLFGQGSCPSLDFRRINFIAKKEVRKIKVYEQSGRNYKPTIMLKGLWLEELEFGTGTLLTVWCEEGKLVIVPREPVDYIDAFEEQQLSMVAERKVRF